MGDPADIDRVQQDLVDVAPAERTAARRAAGAWDGTFVGFEIGLFDRNDACAVIYEAGKASDRQIGEKIYLLAGGKGGKRGTKELTLRETLDRAKGFRERD
jgi:hypothetical protein